MAGNKPGPASKLGETMVNKMFRLQPSRKRLVENAGTADFWRPILETVASYTVLYHAGEITAEQLKDKLGEPVADIVISFADQEPKP